MKQMTQFSEKRKGETAYKLTNGDSVRYISKQEYRDRSDYFRTFGWKAEEVTEFPFEHRFMQHVDGSKPAYDIPNESFVKQLRDYGNIKVGEIAEIKFANKTFKLKAVKISGIRVVWEQLPQ